MSGSRARKFSFPDQRDAKASTEPKTKILIVEDERIVALHLRQTLRALGYEVTATAASGAQALREIDGKRPDLILMDIHIDGDIDGIETTSMIPATLRIPVIYLTAHSEEATLERARATHAYGYLVKPFSDRELHSTIQMVLERRNIDLVLHEREEQLHKTAAELVEQRERLSSALDRVSSASSAKSNFLAVMSHELRTPMNAILGFGQLLTHATFGSLNERQQEYVGHILSAGGHLLSLIDDLLDLGKIEAAQLKVKIDQVDLP